MGDNVTVKTSRQRHELILKIIVYSVSVVLTFMTLYPFLMMLQDFTGFRANNPARILKVLPQRGQELVAFFKSRVVTGFINSVIVAACSTFLNVYFSALTAHSIFAYKWKMRKAFSNFILALMMIPNIVATAGFIQLAYRFHVNNSLALLILPAIATPISVVFMRLYLESSFSLELMDSARIDGAGEFRIFNQIVLPILKPAIATQAIFGLANSWNETFLPLVLNIEEEKKTLPVILILNYAKGENTIPMFVTTIPLVIAFLFLSRHIVEGVQLGSVKM